LLAWLDRSQPVRDADLIVLSEHVDYWNHIGWEDPYSSHEYSDRQGAYARQFNLDTVYTPQMVVDGYAQFDGGDQRRAIQVIEDAAKTGKIPVALSSIHLEGDKTLVVHVETGPLASTTRPGSARLLIALADDSDQSDVTGGENAGRTLRHVAVVRSLIQVGTVDRNSGFSKDVSVSAANANLKSLRVVAILQEMEAGKVLGVGWVRLPN
jgi:hypothetical protein